MDIFNGKLSNISGGRILDVATGRGNFLEVLIEGFKDYDEIVGIDIMDKSIQAAMEKFKQDNIRFLKMDGEGMDFKDSNFDTVCISNSLHHLPQVDRVLEEMKRVLKPGGLFIISEMFSDNQKESQLTHVYMHHWWGQVDTALGIVHNRTYRREEIVSMAEGLNLEALDIFEFSIEDDDPMEEESIEYMIGICDQYIGRAETLQGFKELKERGEQLKQRLRSVGISGASQLVVLGRK